MTIPRANNMKSDYCLTILYILNLLMYKRNGIREYNVGNFRLFETVHLYYQFVKLGIDLEVVTINSK